MRAADSGLRVRLSEVRTRVQAATAAMPLAVPLAFIPLAILVVFLRLPDAVLRPQFYWEETREFWAPTFSLDPLGYLLRPWAGQLLILPRLAFLAARLGPYEIAPAITFLLQGLLIGGVAGFFASNRLALVLPDWRVRMAIALSILVLPVTDPTSGR